MGLVTIGVGIGQKVDPSAVAVAELQWRQEEGRSVDYHVIRHLERLPLGTPYPQVATRLTEIVTGVRSRAGGPTTAVQFDPHITAYRTVPTPAGLSVAGIFVDATGVGLPVVDLLRGAGVVVRPVYFTHGDRGVEQHDRSITLGKAWLVSRLQALLQTGRILLPRSAEAHTLAKELQDYEIKVTEDANDTYGAFKVGTHDDLVTALGLAVQVTPRVAMPVAGGERRYFTQAPAYARVPLAGTTVYGRNVTCPA